MFEVSFAPQNQPPMVFLGVEIRLNQSHHLDIKIEFSHFLGDPLIILWLVEVQPPEKGGNPSRNLQNLENMSPLETWKRPEFFLSKFQHFPTIFFWLMCKKVVTWYWPPVKRVSDTPGSLQGNDIQNDLGRGVLRQPTAGQPPF